MTNRILRIYFRFMYIHNRNDAFVLPIERVHQNKKRTKKEAARCCFCFRSDYRNNPTEWMDLLLLLLSVDEATTSFLNPNIMVLYSSCDLTPFSLAFLFPVFLLFQNASCILLFFSHSSIPF